MKVINKYFPFLEEKNISFLLILLFNLLFFSLVAYLAPIRFQTNDDVGMCRIVSGLISGTPDAHLVFINYLYGWVLTVFYRLIPNIEWYTISFCAIHIISLSIISFSILKTDKSTWTKAVFLLLFYVIEIRIIAFFQFTTTAAIGAFAGSLLLFETKKTSKVSGIILFLIASLIRFRAAMLVFLLMLPCFLYKIILQKAQWKRLIVPIMICICGAYTARFIHNQIYKTDQEWAYYMEYNKLRGRINDNPHARGIMDKLPEGVSQNDYELLLAFNQDGSVINLEKIKKIHSVLYSSITLKQKLMQVYPSLLTYKLNWG